MISLMFPGLSNFAPNKPFGRFIKSAGGIKDPTFVAFQKAVTPLKGSTSKPAKASQPVSRKKPVSGRASSLLRQARSSTTFTTAGRSNETQVRRAQLLGG